MRVIHFTEGATDLMWGSRSKGTRFVPLADGEGDTHVSCLHLMRGCNGCEPPVTHDSALLIVHGRVTVIPSETHARIDLSAGVGFVVSAAECYSLETQEGAIVIVIESQRLEATECGISTPARIAGQRWPGQ
jgi:hypothetical protein